MVHCWKMVDYFPGLGFAAPSEDVHIRVLFTCEGKMKLEINGQTGVLYTVPVSSGKVRAEP